MIGLKSDELFDIFEHVSEQVPNFWMGLNVLGSYPEDTFNKIPDKIFDRVRGIWVDDAHIDERLSSNEQPYPKRVLKAAKKRNFSGYHL